MDRDSPKKKYKRNEAFSFLYLTLRYPCPEILVISKNFANRETPRNSIVVTRILETDNSWNATDLNSAYRALVSGIKRLLHAKRFTTDNFIPRFHAVLYFPWRKDSCVLIFVTTFPPSVFSFAIFLHFFFFSTNEATC